MHQKVITFGNVKTFDGIKKKLVVIDEHLQAVEKSEALDLEILESLRITRCDGATESGESDALGGEDE